MKKPSRVKISFALIALRSSLPRHHDSLGNLPGARSAVMAGFVDNVAGWESFCRDWQAVLNKYKVPLFHFTDWSEASRTIRGTIKTPSNFQESPYFGWDLRKLDRFLYDLAAVAGSGDKVLVGITVPIKEFHARPHDAEYRSTGGD